MRLTYDDPYMKLYYALHEKMLKGTPYPQHNWHRRNVNTHKRISLLPV
jgi:hypothetical protein